MPRVKLQRNAEADRLRALHAETDRVIKKAMAMQGVRFVIELADMTGIGRATLASKFKNGSWTQKDLCKLVAVLDIPPEEAVKMLGVRL